jgi:predicted nuclease with TOPRIM domain
MNKDVDTRLIKNPDYIDALNIRVASSVDGTIGSVENIQGNEKVPTPFYNADQNILFEEGNGLYSEVNPARVFHQEVIRISGWEEKNNYYNFKLYSKYQINGQDTAPLLIGEFSFPGNSDYEGTSSYLYSQFSNIGEFNSDIPIYEYNTGHQYTAKVKLLTFNQYSKLTGGYFEIVIEADTPGVNFVIIADSTHSDDYYDHSYSSDPIPISQNGNLNLAISSSFETGGEFNAETTDEGFIVSPDGAFWEVGNRCLYRFRIEGIEPTSPEDPDIQGSNSITLFSYRKNDGSNAIFTDLSIEVLPFIEIGPGLFDSGDEFEFDSTQSKISRFLHKEFSEPKTVLCRDLPLSFEIPVDNFILTFSNGSVLSEQSNPYLDVMIVGPPGVKFQLAYQTDGQALVQDVGTGTQLGGTPAPIFSTGIVSNVVPLNLLSESSLQLSTGIYDNYSEMLAQSQHLEGIIESNSALITELNGEIDAQNTLLEAQVLLIEQANTNQANAQSNLSDAQAALQGLENENSGLESYNENLQNQINSLESNVSSLESDLNGIINELELLDQHFTSITAGVGSDENIYPGDLSHNFDNLLPILNDVVTNYENFITNLNDFHAGQILEQNTLIETLQDQLSTFMNTTQPALQSTITSLENQISGLEEDVALIQSNLDTEEYDHYETNQFLQEALADVESLTTQLEEANITDIIARETFNEAKAFGDNISSFFESSINSYQQIPTGSNNNIYSSDFSNTSLYLNGFVAHNGVLNGSNGYADLSSAALLSQGYANSGYLRLYNGESSGDANIFSATVLKGNFLGAGWNPGASISGSITFELANQSGGINILLTNFFDTTGEFFENTDQVYLYQELSLSNTSSPQTFSFNFEIPNDFVFDNYNKQLVMIIWGGVNQSVTQVFNTEVRLTNLIISLDGLALESQVSMDNAVEALDNYNALFSEIETIFLNAGDNDIEDHYEAMTINGMPYPDYVFGKVIPGYGSGTTLWDLLREYQNEVFQYGLDIQNQLTQVLTTYSQIINNSDGATLASVTALSVQIQELEAQIAQDQALQSSLELQMNLIGFDIMGSFYDFTAWNVFEYDPYSFCTHLVFAGPEPGLAPNTYNGAFSVSMFYTNASNNIINQSIGLEIYPLYRAPNGDVLHFYEGAFEIMSPTQLNNLMNNPWSSTNNFIQQLRQNISNAMSWNWNAPEGSGFGNQTARFYFANFSGSETKLSSIDGPFPSSSYGLNVNHFGGQDIFENTPMLQLAVHYDNSIATNIPCNGIGDAGQNSSVYKFIRFGVRFGNEGATYMIINADPFYLFRMICQTAKVPTLRI